MTLCDCGHLYIDHKLNSSFLLQCTKCKCESFFTREFPQRKKKVERNYVAY